MSKGRIEQVARTYCVVHEAEGNPVNGGYIEWLMEGSFSDMCDYADEEVAKGSDTLAVTATVTRKAGDFAECRVRTQAYDGEGDDSGEGDEKPGDSRDMPLYSLRNAPVVQPILTHPSLYEIVKNGSDIEKAAWKALVQGAPWTEKVPMESGKNGERKICDVLSQYSGVGIVEDVKNGITGYYEPSITVEVRYTVDDPNAVNYLAPCTIHEALPGPFEKPTGKRNWLALGTSLEQNGTSWNAVETYLLSGVGGWDKDIYKS